MKARAIVFEAPDQVGMRDFDLRAPRGDEVVIETAATCVSPGTELRRLRGKECVGSAGFPLVPGYCLAGRVTARGPEAAVEQGAAVVTFVSVDAGGLKLGEGGHVSHAIAPSTLLARIPDGVDMAGASASVLAGIAFHGLSMARPVPGDKVAVIGLGAIGQMALRLAAAVGADAVGCDLSAGRVDLARKSGARAAKPSAPDALRAAFAPFFPNGADVVVDCTGSAKALASGVAVGRSQPWDPLRDAPGVRYVMLGSYEGDFTVSYAAAYAGQCCFMVPRGSQIGDCQHALDMMGRGQLRLADIISAVRRPEEAGRTYEELKDPQGPLVTAVFDWTR